MLITCPKCSAKYQIPAEVRLPQGKKMKCSACQNVFVFQGEEAVLTPVEPVKEFVESAETPAEAFLNRLGVAAPEKPAQNAAVAPEESVFADNSVFQNEVPQAFLPVAVPAPKRKHVVGVWTAVFSVIVLAGLGVGGLLYREIIFPDVVRLEQSERIKEVKTQAPEKPKAPEVPKERTLDELVKEVMADKQAVSKEKVQSATTAKMPMPSKEVRLPVIQSVKFEKQSEPAPSIRIEGQLKNNTEASMTLPEKVRAVAYSSSGTVLFEKEIYLTEKVLPAGETQPFFGSYQPAPEDVQWVDVTF